jgi:hypothetical protein
MRRGLVGCVAAVMTAVVWAAPGWAATPGSQLDQSSAGSQTTFGLVSLVHSAEAAQTFTAGRTGRLTDVVVNLAQDIAELNPGDVLVRLTGVTGGGAPDTSAVLASATVTSASVPMTGITDFTDIDVAFGAPPLVTAGSRYAIVLSEIPPAGGVPNHAHYFWGGSGTSTYAGGGSYDLDGPGTGDFFFETYVAPSAGALWVPPPSTGAYCSVAGNTWQDGSAILPGTFLYLLYDQPRTDAHYTGATPAIFVEGKGVTCDPPPPGYVQHGHAGDAQHVPAGLYAYFTPS